MSAAPSVELMNVAAMPWRPRLSTWSFINEMRGETTIVVPGRIWDGIW